MIRAIVLLIVPIMGLPALAAEPTSRPADPTLGDPQALILSYPAPSSLPDGEWQAIVAAPRSYGPLRPEADSPVQARPQRYPVIYLLNGFGADYTRWYLKMKEVGTPLGSLADRYNVIFVAANGKPASWYLDAPADSEEPRDWQVETVITKHLVPAVDRRFRTWAEPAGRGLTGMSMGGHGALFLAARHSDLFGACTSLSGVMDLRDSLNRKPLAKRIGPLEEHPDRWLEYSCITQAEKLAGHNVSILIDCGWDDPFITSNRALHEKLMKLSVAHDYIERPGKHNWDCWTRALPYHLQFLADHLKKAAAGD